jgi:DNA-binding transcriptional regulator YdaS (Cro superfamily)
MGVETKRALVIENSGIGEVLAERLRELDRLPEELRRAIRSGERLDHYARVVSPIVVQTG